jgi:hypothetical protein
VLPDLVRYPVSAYEQAVGWRGAARPLLDWGTA